MTVRISGWHVDGFGVLEDYSVNDIQPGLTIFTGPNEAGKSTLLAFIRTMLFGFHGGSPADRQYPPLRGGRHGGRLSLTDADGQTYAVERHAGHRPTVVASHADDASIDDLHRLLGGCDRQLFQSVFAFDLTDLQELEGLNHSEVRERLALVGIAGSGESPAAAINRLEQRRAMAILASGGDGISDLQRRLADVNSSLQAAHERVADGRTMRERELRSISLLEDRSTERSALETVLHRTRALLQAWPDWQAKVGAETECAGIVTDDEIASVAADVEAVGGEVDDYQRATAALPELIRERDAAADAVDSRLRDLGPEWDRARLSSLAATPFSAAEVERLAAEVGRAESAVTVATRELISAGAETTGVARETAQREAERSALTAIIGDRGIEERRAALRRLRARRSDLTSAEVQFQIEGTSLEGLEELREQSARRTIYVPPGWLIAAALAVLVAAALGAVVLFANGDSLTGLVVAAAALGSLVLGLVIRAQNDRAERDRMRQQEDVTSRIAHGQTALDQQQAYLERLRHDIASNAAMLGLPPLPSHTEMEDAERRLIDAEEARRALDLQQGELEQTMQRADEMSRRVAAAEANRERAEAAHREALTDWSSWLVRTELPAALDPRGAVDFLSLVDDGRRKFQKLENAEAAVAIAQQTTEAVDFRLRAISTALDVPHDPSRSDLPEYIVSLRDRLERDENARRSLAALDRQVRQATDKLRNVLGGDEELISALASGDPSGWEEVVAETTSRISQLEEERLGLARARGEAATERHAIEIADDVPTLHLRRNMLETELASALREYRVTILAENMIRETVRRIEEERQPDVLRYASTLFARITDGRYQRVFRPVEGVGLEIEDAAGTTRSPDALSRGTLEQLYVALRLGLAEAFRDKVGALPLIMDDVLVNFDPERARGVAHALFDVSGGRQVLIFTSQPSTEELLSSIGDQYGHFAMERHGVGGAWVRRP